jgi:AbrB family looped-hinge helix DNA binding protein
VWFFIWIRNRDLTKLLFFHIIQINLKIKNYKRSIMGAEADTGQIQMEQDCCCRVASVVSVDERGQMVLPKELRERAGIRPGEKLVAVTMERGGKVCCITLIRAEEMEGMVRGLLGPVMQGIISNP